MSSNYCLNHDSNISLHGLSPRLNKYCPTLFALLLINVTYVSAYCSTPDNRQGRCINFRECNYILRLIEQYTQTHNLYIYQTIWSSVCNYANGNPDVCCPLEFSQSSSGFFIFSSINNNFNQETTTSFPITRTINFGYEPFSPIDTLNTVAAPIEDNRCGIVANVSQTRVIGGRSAQRNAYPWIAALFYGMNEQSMRSLCGGSLITLRHILSAAHCIKPTLLAVRLGAYNLEDPSDGITFKIEWTRQHEGYEAKTIQNDIGVIKITEKAPLSTSIRPICLPFDEPYRSMDYTGYNPIVAGWGSTTDGGSASNIIQEVQIPIISRADCEANYKRYFPNQVFDDRVLCAGTVGKDSCQGDSGQALILPIMAPEQPYYYFIVIGVVSYGYGCGEESFPGVYTKVSSFMPWIQRNID